MKAVTGNEHLSVIRGQVFRARGAETLPFPRQSGSLSETPVCGDAGGEEAVGAQHMLWEARFPRARRLTPRPSPNSLRPPLSVAPPPRPPARAHGGVLPSRPSLPGRGKVCRGLSSRCQATVQQTKCEPPGPPKCHRAPIRVSGHLTGCRRRGVSSRWREAGRLPGGRDARAGRVRNPSVAVASGLTA